MSKTRKTPFGRVPDPSPDDAGPDDAGGPWTIQPGGLSSSLLGATADDLKQLAACLQAARRADVRRFAVKHGRSLPETERAAKRGDLDALCKLIAWNKSWLFRPAAIRAVWEAERTDDRETLRKLANALMMVSRRPRRSPRGAFISHERLRELKATVDRNPSMRRLLGDPKYRATFLQIVTDNDLISEGIEPTYFRTILKRHGMIDPQNHR